MRKGGRIGKKRLLEGDRIERYKERRGEENGLEGVKAMLPLKVTSTLGEQGDPAVNLRREHY